LYLAVYTDYSWHQEVVVKDQRDPVVEILEHIANVSDIYWESFNVRLAVISIDLRTMAGGPAYNVPECTPDAEDKLDAFSEHVSTVNDDRELASLLFTNCYQPNSEVATTVGIAWTGTACLDDAPTTEDGQLFLNTGIVSYQVSDDHHLITAHELGHILGANHLREEGTACEDCACSCFIMEAESSDSCIENQTRFSACNQAVICESFAILVERSRADVCVERIFDTVINHPGSQGICGNGVRDPGEECDGGLDGSACCTPGCALRNGTCDPGNDVCCTDECEAGRAGEVCRPAIGECDVEDLCDGTSTSCGEDTRVEDERTCTDHIFGLAGTCQFGVCTSREVACKEIGTQFGFPSAVPCGNSYYRGDDACDVHCEIDDVCYSRWEGVGDNGRLSLPDGVPCSASSGFFSDGATTGVCLAGRCQGGAAAIVLNTMLVIAAAFCTIQS